MTQPSLLENVPAISIVVEQTRSALKQVEDNASSEWKLLAVEAVEKTCLRLDTFICDDIWASGLESTREDRALGPVMLRARRMGWCEKTGRTLPSKRSHLSHKPVWKSLIFRPEEKHGAVRLDGNSMEKACDK